MADNKPVLDAIAALSAKVEALETKIDMMSADTKASLSKLETKKTTRSTTTAKKTTASSAPNGKRFPPNFMTWFRKLYQSDPEKALELVPASVKEDLDDYKDSAGDKYKNKNKAGQLSAEATFLWQSFDNEIKGGIRTAYNQAKAEHEKTKLEPATAEANNNTGGKDAKPDDKPPAVEDTEAPTQRRGGNKRQVTVE